MAKTTSNLPIVTKVVSMPKTDKTRKNKDDCCMDECECPVCFDDKQLNHLLHDTNKKNYKSCGHYVCEECIIGIMNNKETEGCVCPICRKPFTHYGCFGDIKAVDDYEVVFSQEAYKNQFPKNSLMRSFTPFRIEDAQYSTPSSLITAHTRREGVSQGSSGTDVPAFMNEKMCKKGGKTRRRRLRRRRTNKRK